MKLIEALKIANARQSGPDLPVVLACGFSPLHVETMLKAHLRLRFPERTVSVRTGLYGDLAGTLENVRAGSEAILIALEWADLDPRLGWRSASFQVDGLLNDVEDRLARLGSAVQAAAGQAVVALSLPALPLPPPLFHTAGSEFHPLEAQLWAALARFAANTPAVVLHSSQFAPERHDLRSELTSGFPYTPAHADALAAALVQTAFPLPARKGLITDLDETLWSGVLGDDGPQGISWDLDHKTHFHALYQALLNSLADSGVLIGVASKNDESLVAEALRRPDLIVKPQGLFPIEAHWQPKAESVARTLETWNIHPDSVVFVDDNPLEIEQIKAAFPATDCVLFQFNDPAFLTGLRDRFARRSVLAEDRLRSASLREGAGFRQAAVSTNGLESLLEQAQARLTLHWGKNPPDPRALELVNKTNQFNLNGIRYTPAEWNGLLARPGSHLLVAEYEDRFGKLGKIAVLAGEERDTELHVRAWVMSCRAFSRRIEHRMLREILARWERIVLHFEPTPRNGPLQDFLSSIEANGRVERSRFAQQCPPLFHHVEHVYA